MHTFLVLQFFLCIMLAVLAGLVLIRDPSKRANQLAAWIIAGGACWVGGEVFWNFHVRDDAALALVRVAALGWLGVGPLALHLALEVTGATAHRRRLVLPWLYAGSFGFALLTLATPWLYSAVQREEWGWSYRFGSGLPFVLAFTLACGAAALYTLVRDARRVVPTVEEKPLRGLVAVLALAAIAVGVSDGVLPYLGIQTWKIGSLFYAALSACLAWAFYRHGASLIAPESFAREILDTIPCGVALLRFDGQIRFANRALENLFGCEAGELGGAPLEEFISLPDLAGQTVLDRREMVCTSRDGAQWPIAISSVLLRDRLGLPLGRILSVVDLREVETLRDQLVASDRSASVGELAAGLAHEINNPLALLRSNLQLLRDHWREASEALLQTVQRERLLPILDEGFDMIQESLEGVGRAAKIARELQEFAHAGKSLRELADVNLLLDQVLRIADAKLPPGAVIEKKYEPAPLVSVDRQAMQQVFLNLLLNAARAIGASGRITLATTTEEEWVVVSVEDDGCGIEPELLARIFEPFFTTKPGDSMGLGLTIAHRIVRTHGGDLCVESKSGMRGTRCIVSLPAAGRVVAL